MYFDYYNNITDEEKEETYKKMILVIYFLKILNMINDTKKIKKKVNHSNKKLLLKE